MGDVHVTFHEMPCDGRAVLKIKLTYYSITQYQVEMFSGLGLCSY